MGWRLGDLAFKPDGAVIIEVADCGLVKALVDVNVLAEGHDATHLAGLLAVDADHRTALGNLLLDDVEHRPKGVGLVLVTGGFKEVCDAFLVSLHRGIVRQSLAETEGIEGEFPFLLRNEGHGLHIVESPNLLVHGRHSGANDLTEFFLGVVDVPDADVHEGVGADHEAVGAHEAVDTDTEGEGIEPVIGVGEDDARVAFHGLLLEDGEGVAVAVSAFVADDLAVLVLHFHHTGEIVVATFGIHIVGATDGHLGVLEGHDVEGTDGGLLAHLLLLGIHGKPAFGSEVINDLLSADIDIAVGKVGVGLFSAEDLGCDSTDVILGEELGRKTVIGVGNHSVHFFVCC